MKFSLIMSWNILAVGLMVDEQNRLIIFPIPFIGLRIEFSSRQTPEVVREKRYRV